MEELSKEEKLKFIEKMKFNNRLSYLIISFNQGIGSISELAVQYYFKDELHIEPARLSQIFSLILIPWTIKPLFGIVTDLLPLFGYRRKVYIMLCGFGCIISWLLMSFYVNSLFGAITCLLLINVCLSFSSVLGEAIVVELSQLEKVNSSSSAKDYVSLFFFFKYFGALLSAYLKGLFIEIMSIRWVFFIASILPWLIVSSGFILVEVKVNEELEGTNEEKERLNSNENNYLELKNTEYFDEKLSKESKSPKHAAYNTITVNQLNSNDEAKEALKTANTSNKINEDKNKVTNFPIDIIEEDLKNKKTDEDNINKKMNIDDSYDEVFKPQPKPSPLKLLQAFGSFICQKFVIVPTVFIITLMATPSYNDPFFYFLTNELKFSASSLGKISFCSTATTLFAIWLYRTCFKDFNFRLMITFGTIFSFIFSFMAYLLVIRANVKIGISDFWFVLFSSSFLSMIGELVMMPMLSLACLLCPKNLEGTVYALFMSALNFGGIMSGLFGSFLTAHLGITAKDYSNLYKLITIANILSLVPLPFLLFISDSYFEPKEENNAESEKPRELDYDYNNFEENKNRENKNKNL